MPNRIIKEGICTSEDYAKLSLFQRDLFIRLIVTVDDYGCYDGRAAIIKGKMFPLENVTTKSIEDALTAMASIGIVTRYIVDGKPYLCLPAWNRHQQIRASKSKYPRPNDSDINCNQLKSIDINCNQLISDDINCTRNPIQSESESLSESGGTHAHKYGEYGNVLLTDEEYGKLQAEHPDYQQRINRLSEYIASKGVKYKSHYATIKAWARKDKPADNGSFDTDDFFGAAVAKAQEQARKLGESK